MSEPKKTLHEMLLMEIGKRKPLIVAREMVSILEDLECDAASLEELKPRVKGVLALARGQEAPLVAWVVDDGGSTEHNDLVVAETAEQAVALARHSGWNNWDDPDALQASRAEPLDQAVGGCEFGVVHDIVLLRKLSWQCESGTSCDTCGLSDMDGLKDAWAVCCECGQCAECGHDDECPEKPEVA